MKASTFSRALAAVSILGTVVSGCGGSRLTRSLVAERSGPPISVVGRGAEPSWWERVVEEAPAPGQRSIVLPADVTFDTNSAELSAKSASILREFVSRIGEGAERVVIRAHTDGVGSEEDNLALSERRGRAVADALVASGVPAPLLDVEAVGESEPRAAEDGPDPEQARALNRRVEIVATLST